MIAPQAFEEREQSVGWPYRPGRPSGRRDAIEGALLDRRVRVQVDVRRALLLVAEPEGDGGRVDAGGQQHHRGRVAQRVRRDEFDSQRRTAKRAAWTCFAQALLKRIAGGCSAGPGGE